jgi:hypothetical protein
VTEAAWFIVPAWDHEPGPKLGSKLTAVPRIVDPFLPPASSSLPFEQHGEVWELAWARHRGQGAECRLGRVEQERARLGRRAIVAARDQHLVLELRAGGGEATSPCG